MNNVPAELSLPQRHIFVCGLHRSGTSLITKYLSDHPLVSGFRNTGVIEDEGQFLQTVIPLEIEFGGVGRFGFDPRAHMTETSPLNTDDNARRLISEWHSHWDVTKPVLVEKTPSNLLRMRLLDRLVQPSYFVVVTRHPIATCLATMKWTEGNLFSLFYHWVHCHRIARSDAMLLPSKVIWTSYETFVRQPNEELGRILHFLDLPPPPFRLPSFKNANDEYFALWKSQYCGDEDRAIAQRAPEHFRSAITRVRERLQRLLHDRRRPVWRREANAKQFYDALDAIALWENDVREFGYSFLDLEKYPAS